MTTPKPIETHEFSAFMHNLGVSPKDGPFAVAVSGGPDSMALSLLMADFAPTWFLTFDHGLRPDSGAEANAVHGWLAAKGLGHKTLVWDGAKPKTGLPAAGRAARYKAMEAWCAEIGIKYLLTAHHIEDQAETVLMRLLKGSGIDGLSGMAPKGPGLTRRGVVLLRPLLGQSKARLKATCKARGQAWFEDPTNEDLEFSRARVRKALVNSKVLNAEGLAGLAARLRAAKGFLDDLTENLLAGTFQIHPAGFGVLDGKGVRDAPPAIGRRALGKILGFISQLDYPPADEKLERLYRDMSGQAFKGATLGGCRVMPFEDGRFLFCREARNLSPLTLKPGEAGTWDNRFRVSFSGGGSPLNIGPLGEDGWQRLAETDPDVKLVEIPHPARAALPAFFRGRSLVAVPHLGFLSGKIDTKADFRPLRPLIS